MNKVFVGIATYNHGLHQAVTRALLSASQKQSIFQVTISSTSARIAQLNGLLLAARKMIESCTHVLILDAYTAPVGLYWLDSMLEELENQKCDVLSNVVLAGPGTFLTSTYTETANIWQPKQLSIFDFPPGITTTGENVIISNDCLLIDMRNDWYEKVFFRSEEYIKDGIEYEERESWAYSRDARRAGAKICVSSKFPIEKWAMMAGRNW